MTIRNRVIYDAIHTDLQFVGRFINSLGTVDEELRSSALFCMIGYFSLFIHESRAQLKKLDPTTSATLGFTPKATEVSTRSRHSLKLFEDTARGVSGQLAYFTDEIAKSHKDTFIGKVRIPLAKYWKSDMGITYYDGHLVATTHSVTFGLGMSPQELLGPNGGKTLYDVSTEYGQYLRAWGIRADESAESFVSRMSSNKLKQLDVRSDTVYGQGFNGKSRPDINALLMIFQALINTCHIVLALDRTVPSRQTIFKMKYLTIYQVLRSLELLKVNESSDLTPDSIAHIDALLSHPTAKRILDPVKKPLRNTLMHYGPDTRIDVSRLTIGQPLYGLVEQILSESFNDFEPKLDHLLTHTASVIDQWSSFRSRKL